MEDYNLSGRSTVLETDLDSPMLLETSLDSVEFFFDGYRSETSSSIPPIDELLDISDPTPDYNEIVPSPIPTKQNCEINDAEQGTVLEFSIVAK